MVEAWIKIAHTHTMNFLTSFVFVLFYQTRTMIYVLDHKLSCYFLYKFHVQLSFYLFLGDFEPADIASALLRGFVKEKAERCRLVASLHDLKSIFFVGSFVNHEIVRKVYTEMFTFSNYFIDAVHRKVGFYLNIQFQLSHYSVCCV